MQRKRTRKRYASTIVQMVIPIYLPVKHESEEEMEIEKAKATNETQTTNDE